MKKRKIIVLIITLIFFLNSCSQSVSTLADNLPDIGIPASEINTKIRLGVPKGENSFSANAEINLDIQDISNDEIIFEKDFSPRLFILQDNQWQEVANLVTYEGPDHWIIKPGAENILRHTASVLPKLIDRYKPVSLLIFLIGYVYRDGIQTEEKTSAAVIVDLQPKQANQRVGWVRF